eukprot:22570_1
MTTTLDKIDILLGKYYSLMGRNDYFIDGIGKFKMFCEKHSDCIVEIRDELNVQFEDDSDPEDEWLTLIIEVFEPEEEEEEEKFESFVDIDNEFPFVTNDKKA